MKILSVTTLFPSQAQPVHAVFVYNRLRYLAQYAQIRVIAPIPYFPCDRFIKKYADRHLIPQQDCYGGLDVCYPRYLSIPLILKPLDGFFLGLAVWLAGRKLKKTFEFEVLDTHLAFPDGFAGVWLGRLWKKPVSITVRGHDVNVLPSPQFPVRKKQIQTALRRADLVIGVAEALRQSAMALGASPQKTVTISNGVETARFFPGSRHTAREKLGLPLDRPILLSVGRIVQNKGYHLIVEALAQLHQSEEKPPFLVIVGGAADEALYPAKLQETITRLHMHDHVRLAGPQKNEDLRDWYQAADVYCLASQTEGWPNVLLEALACGTPVVATKIWGVPEIINDEAYGILVERSVEDIARGVQQALQKEWDVKRLVAYAATHTWDRVGKKIADNFARLLIEKSS